MNFSYRLADAMSRKGLNQKELAMMADIPQGAISNYCNGKGMPSSEVLFRLSRALSVSMEWLVSGEAANLPCKADSQWKNRALDAEEKLHRLKIAMSDWIKKI